MLQAKELPEARRKAWDRTFQAGTEPQRERVPEDTMTSDHGLQNWEAILFCCSKLISLWYFVTVALEKSYRREVTDHQGAVGASRGQGIKDGLQGQPELTLRLRIEVLGGNLVLSVRIRVLERGRKHSFLTE